MNQPQGTALENNLKSFMSVTARKRVAVSVPLFGYWKDTSGQLNGETLKYALSNLQSSVHQVYLVFTADSEQLTKDVGNILMGKSKGGNSKGIPMKKGKTYADYFIAGLKTCLEDFPEAEFIVHFNPWAVIQPNGLDILIDRTNAGIEGMVGGFDVKGKVAAENFKNHSFQLPAEYRDVCLDFFAMKRALAEQLVLDAGYKTHYFLPPDIFQSIRTKRYEAITTQKVPILTFDLDWKEFETREQFEMDRAHFQDKWKFGIEANYE
jgi:hypothetical protein